MATFVEAVVMMLTLFVVATTTRSAETRKCVGLASYQLVLKTFWSKETFHKQYPTYRPHAQWSKLIGRSHSRRYSLWSEGQMATDSLREFTEKGQSTALDMEAQGSKGIFNAFMGPNISAGVGSSVVKFLVHPNYPKMSFIVRIIPSPDWFVGVDSLELCADGQWISEKTMDLHPMDGGTERGYTYTSPQWPETVQKAISAMTSKFPSNPASSFYYPELASLPPIAQFKLTRIDMSWDDTAEEPKQKKAAVSAVLSPETQPAERKIASVVVGKSGTELEVESSGKNSSTETFPTKLVRILSRKFYNSNGTRQLRSGSYGTSRSRVSSSSGGEKVDCQLSAWNDWSLCSKTCGFGVRSRTRHIIQRSRNGGHPCPPLREQELCGSMRTCNWQHFSHLNAPPAEIAIGNDGVVRKSATN